MARHNLTFLYGFVSQEPHIVTDEDGNYKYGMVYITVTRSLREVGDKRHQIKLDYPLIMTMEPNILDEISKWHKNDMVYVKGTIACKSINKTSFCPDEECGEKNLFPGALVYVNPIYVEKMRHYETTEECLEDIKIHKEISNEVYVIGTLCRDPKKIHTKNNLTVTQYQIALNRKYRIRTDPPEIRSDYPWVKSYGEKAVEDKKRLHVGSVVFVDGCLQARTVHRKAICQHCGKEYIWDDKAMEIVPYDTEYMPGTFYSDEEIEANELERLENIKKSIFSNTQTENKDIDDDEDPELSQDDEK